MTNQKLLNEKFLRIEQNYIKEMEKFQADNELGENYFIRINTEYPNSLPIGQIPCDFNIAGSSLERFNYDSVKKLIYYFCDIFDYLNTLYEGQTDGAIKHLLSWTDEVNGTDYMKEVE